MRWMFAFVLGLSAWGLGPVTSGPVNGSLVAPAAAQSAPQKSDTLAQVENHLRLVNTLRADFTQTADTGAVSQGQMALAKPGKIRFEFEKGVPLLIVSNGSVLSMVDYEVAQVTRWPVKETPLALLLDAKVSLRGRATIVPPNETPPGYLAVEGRDPKHPEYGTITLFFQKTPQGPAGLMLAGWRVLDGQGRTTLVQLSNVRLNVSVPQSAFTFRDPRGLRTAKPGKML